MNRISGRWWKIGIASGAFVIIVVGIVSFMRFVGDGDEARIESPSTIIPESHGASRDAARIERDLPVEASPTDSGFENEPIIAEAAAPVSTADVTVMVVDSSGRPLESISVRIDAVLYWDGLKSPSNIFSGITNAAGVTSLPRLPHLDDRFHAIRVALDVPVASPPSREFRLPFETPRSIELRMEGTAWLEVEIVPPTGSDGFDVGSLGIAYEGDGDDRRGASTFIISCGGIIRIPVEPGCDLEVHLEICGDHLRPDGGSTISGPRLAGESKRITFRLNENRLMATVHLVMPPSIEVSSVDVSIRRPGGSPAETTFFSALFTGDADVFRLLLPRSREELPDDAILEFSLKGEIEGLDPRLSLVGRESAEAVRTAAPQPVSVQMRIDGVHVHRRIVDEHGTPLREARAIALHNEFDVGWRDRATLRVTRCDSTGGVYLCGPETPDEVQYYAFVSDGFDAKGETIGQESPSEGIIVLPTARRLIVRLLLDEGVRMAEFDAGFSPDSGTTRGSDAPDAATVNAWSWDHVTATSGTLIVSSSWDRSEDPALRDVYVERRIEFSGGERAESVEIDLRGRIAITRVRLINSEGMTLPQARCLMAMRDGTLEIPARADGTMSLMTPRLIHGCRFLAEGYASREFEGPIRDGDVRLDSGVVFVVRVTNAPSLFARYGRAMIGIARASSDQWAASAVLASDGTATFHLPGHDYYKLTARKAPPADEHAPARRLSSSSWSPSFEVGPEGGRIDIEVP